MKRIFAIVVAFTIAMSVNAQVKKTSVNEKDTLLINNEYSVGCAFSLLGRTSVLLPTPEYHSNVQGKIVIKIWVDRNGNVTKAEVIEKDTTINDVELIRVANETALKAVFNADENMPEMQIGTIKYTFKMY